MGGCTAGGPTPSPVIKPEPALHQQHQHQQQLQAGHMPGAVPGLPAQLKLEGSLAAGITAEQLGKRLPGGFLGRVLVRVHEHVLGVWVARGWRLLTAASLPRLSEPKPSSSLKRISTVGSTSLVLWFRSFSTDSGRVVLEAAHVYPC